MATQRVLVVGGTGHIGNQIVSALRKAGSEVRLLLRPETVKSTQADKKSMLDGLSRQGAKVVEGSMEDAASLERACAEMDAVVSCVNGPQLALQPALVKAAAKAKTVQRFIPSEFGFDPMVLPKGKVTLFDWKRELHDAFASSGVPTTYLYSNGFATYWASGLGQLGLTSPPKDKANVFGDGNMKLAIVSPQDIAQIVARVLNDPRTANKEVAILPPANMVTQNELISLWESKSGTKLQRNVITEAQMHTSIADMAKDPNRMMEMLYTQVTWAGWVYGIASSKRAECLEATALYPDLKLQTVSSFLDQFRA